MGADVWLSALPRMQILQFQPFNTIDNSRYALKFLNEGANYRKISQILFFSIF